MPREKPKKHSDSPPSVAHNPGQVAMDTTPMPVSDQALIAQSVDGSLPAFEQLLSRYEKRVYGFIFQSCRNAADASDLTQETFLRAFQALDRFDLRYPFAAWLFSIARRKCIDFHRARKLASDYHIPDLPDPNDPSLLVSRAQDREQLWDLARQKLSDLQYEILWLKYVEDMNVAEVARIVGKTGAHVKILLFRARRTLGRELERQSNELAETRAHRGVRSAAGAASIIHPITS
jgi:RNA polymerase sigma-70 factor (ECF subfamily)